ncbi:efflux RND transporter periplasmic adaptor subunit [Mastigocladopsis repens]|uniref:efflux RND transporter periplasmic adaptor subunit n=1 Tax=Mastigocladopsis repens TaxID=221287 RepID=UPI00030ACDB1|nr:efflux RND transporter periplasmic adaptor subunit [Mastigocladopsis repens]
MNTHQRINPLSHLFWLLLILPLVGGCHNSPSSAEAQQPSAISVKLSTVETDTVDDSSEYIATLESRKSVTLQPRVEGQISRILVQPGKEVTAGTSIMEIDPARQRASVSGYAAAVASAKADIENAKATLRTYIAQQREKQANLLLSQQQYNRYSTLQTQGAVSKQTRDEYANSLDVAQASLAAKNAEIEAQKAAITRAEQALQQSQANIQEQQVQLQYFSIAAPFTGRVGDIPVKVGDFVNTSTRLVTITQNNQLEVNLSIPTEQAARIRLGTQIELTNPQGKPLGMSRVFFIAPNTSNNTQSVLVKALLNNAQARLRADQQVRARVIWARQSGVLIPTMAVSRVAGQNFVFVAEPKKGESGLVARQRLVKLGSIQANSYQVLEGLKPGERIAVTGLLQLSDGSAITPES